MIKLMRMDGYLLFHSISTWIMFLFIIALAVLCVGVTNSYLHSDFNRKEAAEDINKQPFREIESNKDANTGKMEAGTLLGILFNSGIIMLVSTIFITSYVNAEQKNGFLKNIAGQLPNRSILILSKFYIIGLETLIIFILFSAFAIVAGYFSFQDQFVLDLNLSLLKLTGVQFILHLGYGCLVLLLYTAAKSELVTIAAGFLLSGGLMNILYSGVDHIILTLFPASDFQLGRYMLDRNIFLIDTHSSSQMYKIAAAVGLLSIIIFNLCSIVLIRKRDII